MSRLGDMIIEHGPYDGVTPPLSVRSYAMQAEELNALRDELIGLRSDAADRHRANELSDRIAAELRLVTRERDALARRCAVRFDESEALRARLAELSTLVTGSLP